MNYIAVFLPIFLVGITCVVCALIKLIYLDAISREMSHPKLWAVVGAGGNNGSGILMYLIHRKNYPIKKELNESDRNKYLKYKKAIYVGLAFMSIGAIGIVVSLMSSSIQ